MNIGDTTVVGKYSPKGDSPYNCADIAGNVWEWVNDWYGEGYYANSPSDNPAGPGTGADHVLRGGSWDSGTRNLRASNRNRIDPTYGDVDIGFRCVR